MPFATHCMITPRNKTARNHTKPKSFRFVVLMALAMAIGWGSIVSAQDKSPRPPEPPLPELKTPARPPEPPLPDVKSTPPLAKPAVPALRILPRPPEPPLPVDAVFAKSGPSNIADLRLIQNHVRELSKKLIAATVGIRIGAAQGSGVIITGDGYVLTAGHVSGKPNRVTFLILPDGRVVKGKTLGANRDIDSGLIKITDKNPDGGPWQHVNIGRSQTLTPGTWCICTGHPGGYKRGRPPVVRLGRVLSSSKGKVISDCTMVGGDSGGPLFNMDGDVIGINSQIGGLLTANIHVPVDTFHGTWDRLAKGDEWGYLWLGITKMRETKITAIMPDSSAARAGIKKGDVIKKFEGRAVRNLSQMDWMARRTEPNAKVKIEIARDGKTIEVQTRLGKYP